MIINIQLNTELISIKLCFIKNEDFAILTPDSVQENVMNVILEAEEALEPELKAFTESRVKFSFKKLFWMVRKINVRYSLITQSKTLCNQHCQISLETFDHRYIEIGMTARDRRTALDMGLKKIGKQVQKAFHQGQQYGRLSKMNYV